MTDTSLASFARSLKVLVVTNMYPVPDLPWYGSFVRDQVRALERKGVTTEVFFVNGRESRWNYFKGIPALRRKIRQGDYDLIHAHYVFSGVLSRFQRRLPVLLNFHGSGEAIGYQGFLCRRVAPLMDDVIVTSDYHKETVGIEKAHVIPCGVDMEVFKPMEMGAARKELGFPAGKKLALFPAAMRPEKRVDLAQAAMAIVRERLPGAELIVATGQPHEKIPLYMNACDVMIMTSDREGSPVSIKEAMACNEPIVSVRVADTPELIGKTEGCYLCKQDPEDIAEKILRAFEFGKRTRGREDIRPYDNDVLIDRVIELYRRLLGRNGA